MSSRLNKLIDLVRKEFASHFSGDPIIVNSPGRINILGEHTDYNGGYVLPAAIDKSIVMAIAKNGTECLNLLSIDYHDKLNLKIGGAQPLGNWSDYIMGVALEMKRENYHVGGFDMAFTGDIPIGSGLSSSAALECGVAIALNKIFAGQEDRRQLSLISQAAENNYVGVQCGVMDQYASLMGQENTIIRLDCKNISHQYLQLDMAGHELILCNSGVNHALASSDYNVRRNQCQEGLEAIQAVHPEINYLCDASMDILNEVKGTISSLVYQRCQYVIKENERVLAASESIRANDLDLLGRYMYETHEGLRNEFEISCDELDYLVDITKDDVNILGSRMMGGGFGGCTLNLIKQEAREFFNEDLKQAYYQKFGKELTYIDVKLTNGGEVVL